MLAGFFQCLSFCLRYSYCIHILCLALFYFSALKTPIAEVHAMPRAMFPVLLALPIVIVSQILADTREVVWLLLLDLVSLPQRVALPRAAQLIYQRVLLLLCQLQSQQINRQILLRIHPLAPQAPRPVHQPFPTAAAHAAPIKYGTRWPSTATKPTPAELASHTSKRPTAVL